jgi:type IX secretion system PorP/SprF family membrane protein
MMKKSLTILLSFLCSLAVAQNAPSFRQFYFNPFLFNPAFAGTQDYASVGLVYRQQWVGFNNAPSAAGFTLQVPSYNRVSFGLNIYSQEVVALQTNSSQATFAYRVPLSEKQFLFFGISGVVGFNNLKQDADYSNDPTILNAAANTFFYDANFGIVYSLGGLRIGFAMPKLLGQKYYSPQDLVNVRYAQFRNQLYSISYKFSAGDFSFEPYALYRINRDLQNWWEGAMTVYYKDKIWLGGSYHETLGAGFFLGMNIKEKLRVGYSFELPPVDKTFGSVNSHELQLQLRLGKKRMFKWASRYESKEQAEVAVVPNKGTITPVSKDTISIAKTVEVKKEDKVTVYKPQVQEVKVQLPTTQANEIVNISSPQPGEVLVPGYYIIIGSFKSKTNAESLQSKFIDMGFAGTSYGLNMKNELYYVYLFYSDKLEEGRKALDQFRQKPSTKNAWLLKV